MPRLLVPPPLARSTIVVGLLLGAATVATAGEGESATLSGEAVAVALAADGPGTPGAATPETPETPPVRWVSSVESSGRDYRWSLSRGALDIGLAFDAAKPHGVSLGLDPRPELSTAAVGADALPALSVGVRREAPAGRFASSTLLQRVSGVATTDGYVSKLGVQWKPAQSQVNFLREGLGFRLDGNDRMTVRLRKGVLGIYMQRKF